MIRSKNTKNLSATSIRKIRRMIAAVLAEPEFYNQDTFGKSTCEEEGDTVCGTVCCAAGWAIWLDDKAKYQKLMKRELRDMHGLNFSQWVSPALKALGLNIHHNDAFSLFGASHDWPGPFWSQYAYAETAKQRAKVFAKRWEKFISSDGTI